MKLKNNEPCPACGRFANRGVTIDALILRKDKILLIKRAAEPFKGFWALPGGYVEWDETTEEAVQREVEEEVGLSVTSLKFIGLYSNPKRHPKQCIDLAYAVETEGEVKAGDDAADYEWKSIQNLPDLALDHRHIIDDYLKSCAIN
jgi:8-oxo-dGTP diphosphatase